MMSGNGDRVGAFSVHAIGALLGLVVLAGCESSKGPTGPPSCEPDHELVIERALKIGYRELHRRSLDSARQAFNKALALAPDHPEARAGVSAVAQTRTKQIRTPDRRAGSIEISGDKVWLDLAINGQQFRYEEERKRREAARRIAVDPDSSPLPRWYGHRTTDGGVRIAHTARDKVTRALRLVVLHDSMSTTAREAFVKHVARGTSAHFTVDYDGTVFQNLDLAHQASREEPLNVDRKSIVIELVNPVDLTEAPLPEGASEGLVRPRSAVREIQGEQLRHWGYTDPQRQSLGKLVVALTRVLPHIDPSVPRDAAGRVPMQFLGANAKGIVGHLHVSPAAHDPGAGLDWETLSDQLRQQ